LQKLPKRPVPLASLAGTYRWVYLTQTSWPSIEFRYESDPEVAKREYPDYPGFFKLSFPAEDEKPSLDNVRGEFRFWDIKGSFVGVEPHKNQRNGQAMENAWDVREMRWDPSPRYRRGTYGIVHGHWVEVCDAVDDNGSHFVTLVWDQGWEGCAPHFGDWVGKRQLDDEALVGLTDTERERMGMYLTEEEVQKRAAGAAAQEKKDDATTDGKRKVKEETEEEKERDVKRKRED
jgi:hypothetical protein